MTGRLALETEIEALRAEFVDFDHRSAMLTPEEHARWRAIAERGHALRNQLATREPLTPAEMAAAYAVDATGPVSREMWRPLVERLRRSAGGKAPVPRARAAHPDDGTIA